MKRNINSGIAMKIYRIEQYLYIHKLKLLAKLVSRLLYLLCNCVIPPSTKIGKGTIIPHSVGIVIHQYSVIGENCVIYQNVTIGNANGPKIGSGVIIGSGACILGDITIGDNVKIGANAVVLQNVPDNVTVVGIPAKIKK